MSTPVGHRRERLTEHGQLSATCLSPTLGEEVQVPDPESCPVEGFSLNMFLISAMVWFLEIK